MKVKTRFIDGTRIWNRGKISRLFSPQVAEAIRESRVRSVPYDDWLIWKIGKTCKFSGKEAYVADRRQRFQERDNQWIVIWKLNIPERIKHLIWRITHNGLPTMDQLIKRNLTSTEICALCSGEFESILHWKCLFAHAIWFASSRIYYGSISTMSDGKNLISTFLQT